MATRTTMAMNALILLGLLLLLPCASVAEEEAAMEALFAHVREIQQISKSELEKFNAKGLPDLVASAGVESVAGAGVESADAAVDVEQVVVGDAASELMAHIYAVQRKALEANAEAERLRADASETVNVEGAPVHDEEEEEVREDLEQDGVDDPLAQERIRQLDATLKTLTDNAVDNEGELGAHNMRLSAAGANGDDVINLLHKYAQEMHQKLYPNGVAQESRPEDDPSHEDGEIDPEHIKNHDDHFHLHAHNQHHDHEHGHGHEYHHHHHDHDHDHDHANVGFSRASDGHDHNHHQHGGHSHGHDHRESIKKKKFMLPEEIAEEEDLLQYGFHGQVYSSAEQPKRLRGPDTGVWLQAMGCSLLVSLASLICLMLLPCIVSNGKPSETAVNALAAFGAGAMLGDAFLHQLPHAFGNSGSPPHSHDAHQHDHDHGHSHSHSHGHDHSSADGQGHAHSLQDLSIGLAVLGGILLFFVVEKIVRRYEELSSHGGQRALGPTHHHHQKRKDRVNKLEGPEKNAAVGEVAAPKEKESKSLESKSSDLKMRKGGKKKDTVAVDNEIVPALIQSSQQVEASGGFVIGYLNLFSDAVHNFTDGMALGSAFLLHGTVGGWS